MRIKLKNSLMDSEPRALDNDGAAWQIIEVRRQEVRQPVEFLSQAARVDPRGEQTAAAALCLVAFDPAVLEPRAAQAKAGISDALAQLPPVRCAAALCQLGILRHVLQSLAANLSDAGAANSSRLRPGSPAPSAALARSTRRASLQPESLIYAGPNTFSPDGRGLRSRSEPRKSPPARRVGRLRRAVLEATPTYRDIRPTPKESGRAGG